LETAVGSKSIAGKKLKARSGWNKNGNGKDEYGFSALPGGNDNGSCFYCAGNYGHWWTATENSSGSAYCRGMFYNFDNVFEYDYDKGYGFSLRCVAD